MGIRFQGSRLVVACAAQCLCFDRVVPRLGGSVCFAINTNAFSFDCFASGCLGIAKSCKGARLAGGASLGLLGVELLPW
eukprot:1552073-Alexandrium_andersonii.AAC.1